MLSTRPLAGPGSPLPEDFGNKYKGLAALKACAWDADISVPPFIGLSEDDIGRLEKDGSLPRRAFNWLAALPKGSLLMVRSSGNLEDGAFSNAGAYLSVSGVVPDPACVAAVCMRVAASFSTDQAKKQTQLMRGAGSLVPLRRGIVIQVMVGEHPLSPVPESEHSSHFRSW